MSSAYVVQHSAFQDVFAKFVNFVGGDDIDRRITRVDHKLDAIAPLSRELYGDRYYFHNQFPRFADGLNPFQLDTNDFYAVRAATLMQSVNDIADQLTEKGRTNLRGSVRDKLGPDSDLRHLEHELRCFVHLKQRGCEVSFPDFEKSRPGKVPEFDAVTAKGVALDVECKTVTEDTGVQIKTDLAVGLREAFTKTIEKSSPVKTSGLFTLELFVPADEMKSFAKRMADAIAAFVGSQQRYDDFSLTFEDRPQWQQAFDSGRMAETRGHDRKGGPR